jgi:hypothetical protein
MTQEKKDEIKEKVMAGLALSYERLIEFKRQKNSPIVISRDNKIIFLKPWEDEGSANINAKELDRDEVVNKDL